MIKQVIAIRTDLKNVDGQKVRTGKIIAQACHATKSFLFRNSKIEVFDTSMLFPKGTFRLESHSFSGSVMQWIEDGTTTIVVKVNSEEELESIYQQARTAGLFCEMIIDAGRTEFGGVPTKTCLAIGPNNVEQIDKITGHLELF